MPPKPLPHPDFMLIGAGKSGTTALQNYMQQHPQIFIPRHKDPSYLALIGEKPPQPGDDPEGLNYHPYAIYDSEEYLALFEPAEAGQLAGDISTMYMFHSKAAENILQYCPEAKIMAILRHPADRLYSRYLHLARDGRHHETPLETIFDRSSIWWRRNDLIHEGLFYQHLKRYYDRFDASQLKIFLYDDLQADEEGLTREIWRFLGIDEDFVPDAGIRFNQSGIVKNAWKDYLIGHPSILRRSLEAIAPGLVQRMRDHAGLQRIVSRLRSKNLERPDFDPVVRKRITKEIYREDILHLQKLINRDLSHWLEE